MDLKTQCGKMRVSTIHYRNERLCSAGIDCDYFETMIFGEPYDQDCWRYSIEEAATAGHARVVASLNAGANPRDENSQ